jgi:hypothetical protein
MTRISHKLSGFGGVQPQLEKLKTLKDGWYDGKGLAPSAEDLDWLAESFNEHYTDTLALPYVYPVVEGGVRFEWTFGPNDISLDIDLQNRAGEWHVLDLETDHEETRQLKLDTKDGWTWMVERLQILSRATS